MLKIGKLKLKSNLILSPMAGISDLPFRLLNRDFGCELAFVEMLNVRSMSYKSKKTAQMLVSGLKDRPLGIQLLGSEPKFILKAMDILSRYKFDVLDFNAACPVRKIVRRGEGASLMRHPKKLNRLLGLIVKNSAVAVTVKIRTGWDKDSVNAREVALYAQDAGIDALFIHGRTRTQGYSGSVDYGVIRDVKKAVKIPVIASGDIFSPQLAKKMFDDTGCDALAIARGALGNPWIFKEVSTFLKNGRLIKRPAISQIVRVMLEHLDASIDFHGEHLGVIRFRKFFGWYTKGFYNVRCFRKETSLAKTRDDMVNIIKACHANYSTS